MARKNQKNRSSEVLDSLRTWSLANDLRYNSTVARLMSDLESDTNLKIWADLNPNEYLPSPIAKSSTNGEKRINLLTGLRNIMVFTPVALTWAAISVVTNAFSSFQSQNPNSVVNFLDFWQQGYEVVPDFWRLSNVAIFDVILVLLVIILTGSINFLNQRVYAESELELLNLNAERAQLIFELNRFFYPYKYPTPSQINRNLLSATKSLDKTLVALTRIVTRLERDIAKYPNSTKLVNEIKDLNKTIKKIPKK